jgi:hypothetical protein
MYWHGKAAYCSLNSVVYTFQQIVDNPCVRFIRDVYVNPVRERQKFENTRTVLRS